MRNILSILVFLLFSMLGKGQAGETYTVMHYNLLYYGYDTSFCTSSNNNVDQKDGHLSVIIDFVQPDIFTVNELGQGPSGPQDSANLYRILNNVLNATGEARFSAAPYTNTTNSTIVNGLFYDNSKFVFHNGEIVSNVLRDINLYTLYVKDEELLLAGDTIFLHAIVAHLKAGSTTSDQNIRTNEIQTVMSYIIQNNLVGNAMFLADMNMKSSFEFAYQHLTFHVNQEIRFNDPLNKPGTWNNSIFSQYHTQSTRTSSGCFAGGGMDDRFDQILLTTPVISGAGGLNYVEGSYYALGQDGQRYNQSLISPPNLSAPPNVINALFSMSDHLPVVLEIERVGLPSSVPFVLVPQPDLIFTNPARGSLNIEVRNTNSNANVSIFSLSGQLLKSVPITIDQHPVKLSIIVRDLSSGMYFVRLEGNEFLPVTRKLLIVN